MTAEAKPQGQYARLKDLELYYEISGRGQSLILLPGSFYTIEMMGVLVPELAATRQVIAVELQGLAHTGDVARPLRFELLADDIAALIAHLGLERVDLFGYSLGGGVALQTAIRHPQVVGKVALASTPFKCDGRYPQDRATMTVMSVEGVAHTPLPEVFHRTSPTPDGWTAVVAKVRELATAGYDWTTAVAALRTPVLLLAGDGDGVSLAHVVEFFGLPGGGLADGDLAGLPASALAGLPATTHVGRAPPYHGIRRRTHLLVPLVPMITEFLDAPAAANTACQ